MTLTRKAFLIATTLATGAPALALADCADLAGMRVAPDQFGLPSGGAQVDSATPVAAAEGLPAYCAVSGRIDPASAGAPPILFRLNLPDDWNGKALQMGGGGLNGYVVDGLGQVPGTVAGGVADRPLAQGYVTFGSDSGHQAEHPADARFGTIPEALENYGGAAVKRLHDAALPLIVAHYGRAPARMYHVGGSKGGHESLVAAQRFGADYDGIVAYYPTKDSTGLILGWHNMVRATYGVEGAAIPPAKQEMIRARSFAACDGLDGLEDQIIANTAACLASFSPAALACPEGAADTSGCLTPPQVGAIEAAHRRFALPKTLANGVTEVGPWPVLLGGNSAGRWLDAEGTGESTPIYTYVQAVSRYFWTGDPELSLFDFDPAIQSEGMLAYSQIADATDPDLSELAAHEGKLILVQGTIDMLVPVAATTDWYLQASARLGAAADDTLRYFIQPGYGHGQGEFRLDWDSLAALDHWVETGTAPEAPIAHDGNEGAARTMPLCAYPAFPRYLDGPTDRADSFVCALK